jgi:Helix-turn-helix
MDATESRGRALSELLTDDELLAELADAHATLTKAYAEFRTMAERRKLLTGALSARGFSQRKIAAHLGLSQAAVARYVRGSRNA